MKKIFFYLSFFILITCFSSFVYINWNILNNIKLNREVLNIMNSIKGDNRIVNNNYHYPKIEINNRSYLGIININDISLPVLSECHKSFLGNNSSCRYYQKDSLIIMGTNLKDSFYNYNQYEIFDVIEFYDNLYHVFEYEIKDIKRIKSLKKLSKIKSDFMLIIKDYYDLEYVVFVG